MKMDISLIVELSLAWVIFPLFTLTLLSTIEPKDRKLTRWRWVRILLIIGGPLTYVVVPVAIFVSVIFVLLVHVPEFLRDVLRN